MTPQWITQFLDVPRAEWSAGTRFWSAATATELSPARGEDDQFITLLPARGTPWVRLQRIDGPPRVHLDLATSDVAALVGRAVELGAERAWHEPEVTVLRSPGGLLLCVTGEVPARPGLHGRSDAQLDQVCLDIPPRVWEPEVAFWTALSGRTPSTARLASFTRLAPGRPGEPRVLLQRLEDDQPVVTAHPDFATADRAAQIARHESLGAVRLADHEFWTVLRAPSGHRYCLTDRSPETGSL